MFSMKGISCVGFYSVFRCSIALESKLTCTLYAKLFKCLLRSCRSSSLAQGKLMIFPFQVHVGERSKTQAE